MARNEKTILIVDDSELDREILKSILSGSFETMEAENGFVAIEMITTYRNKIDAIMLDISMPHISGFDVLRLLQDNGLNSIPVFLITAEATKENVLRAAQFNVSEFISKPFDRDDILHRTKSLLGITTQYWLVMEDYIQMNQYIDRLETLFRQYLTNFDKNDLHYRRMTELMKIMLARYSMRHRDANLDKDKIEIISKAAYFCDIGMMLVPDKMAVFSRNPEKFDQLTKNHTKYGTYLIKLGENPHCEFFISICSDMCMNHHERFDGFGYPRGIGGKNLSPYSQLCHLADELDTLFSKLYGSNEIQVNLVMKQMLKDQGAVSEELLSLFEDCKQSFIGYYSKKKGD